MHWLTFTRISCNGIGQKHSFHFNQVVGIGWCKSKEVEKRNMVNKTNKIMELTTHVIGTFYVTSINGPWP